MEKALGEGVSPFQPRRVGDDGELVEAERPSDCDRATEPAPESPPPAVDLERIRKQAFEQGFAEGERSGAEAARGEGEEKLERMGKIVAELASCKSSLRAEAEREVVELAFAVARRVLHRELTLDPGVAAALVGSCLDEFAGAETVRILLNQADLELVRERIATERGVEIETVADDSVSPGGAVIETRQGKLDARIESQLEEIESGLADGVEGFRK